jgi:uroporphyrinogen-III decarboxylase
MNPKRGVRNVEVDLRIGRDELDRANRNASEQESRRCLDPMRSIYDRCGKGQRTTLHEVPATTRHCLDLGCEIALERRRDNLERSWTAVRRPTPGS